MEKLIVIALFALAIIWMVIVVVTLIMEYEQKKADQEEVDEQFNNRMITKCLQTRRKKACPGRCDLCSWGLRQKNGVIEFREKK